MADTSILDNADVRAALIPKMSRYSPHTPFAKQQAFLLLDCREAFYGGAGGGGKSDALLMAALQYVDIPGYAALILRRTYRDLALPQAIMARAHEWLQGKPGVKWDDEEKTYSFATSDPARPATLTFGYLETEMDKYRYQGAELQFVGFDELTQFSQSQYTYLFSRVRRKAGLKVPLRVRSASNPGGIGHDWVEERLVNAETRRAGVVFIPSGVDDNEYIDREEYHESLSYLDDLDRAQIERGDWKARPMGRKFKREWFEIIEGDALPAFGVYELRYWDLASTEPKAGKDPDFTAGVRLGCKDGVWYVLNLASTKDIPSEVERLIKNTASADSKKIPVRMEQEPGSSGVTVIDHYARRVLVGYDFDGIRATGNKEVRANPFSAAAKNGLVKVVRGEWNKTYFDQLESFPQKGFHDDFVDASSGAFAEITKIIEFTMGDSMAMKIDGYDPQPEKRPSNLTEWRARQGRSSGGFLAEVRRV